MVTIYDIAKKTGYAPATVSKALNDKPDISAKTKEKIHAVAKEMGYSPNSQAIALSTNKTWNIGVLFEDGRHNGFTHYLFSKILESLKKEAELSGYDITFISQSIAGRDTTYLEHARYRRCEGIIIACVDFTIKGIRELVDSEIPVVVIDHLFDSASTVKSDNIDGMRKIVYYLKAQGHKNITYIHGEPSYVTEQRIESFIKANEDFQDQGKYNLIEGVYSSKTDAYNKTNLLFQKTDEIPSAIVYPDDYSALGGIDCILEYGYNIPDDIAVVGFDGVELGEIIKPSLTTIKQDTNKMGRLAVKQLLKQIENPDEENVVIQVPVKLVERDSSK
uniref:Transcriptional regulator, LacI family n=1 Tax=Clostridium grantii DSM 8605 TaxID=1121316 RepID=A0A1M5T2U0_9CLOT|nr:LacI family DNA-binding transcriptional regulator [Clostridium grantii]SHH45006.1 transcriptional regulator, LacI family [Clostridium grantii DSM 8605]